MSDKDLIPTETEPEWDKEGVSKAIVGATELLSDCEAEERRNIAFWLLCEAQGLSKKEAALRVGLHPNSGPRLYRTLVDNQNPKRWSAKIIQRLQDRYKLKNALRLEKVDDIEAKVMEFLEANPQEAHRFAALFRQTKAVGGLLNDGPPPAPVVSIEKIQNLMLNVVGKGDDNDGQDR